MRELTKSMMSCTWALSVFGAQQLLNLFAPGQGLDQTGKCGQSFDKVTDATAKTFDGPLMQAFRAGDSMQRGLVDIMFGGFAAGGCDPNRWMRMGSDAVRQATDAANRTVRDTAQATANYADQATSGAGRPSNGEGWGPMPR